MHHTNNKYIDVEAMVQQHNLVDTSDKVEGWQSFWDPSVPPRVCFLPGSEEAQNSDNKQVENKETFYTQWVSYVVKR